MCAEGQAPVARFRSAGGGDDAGVRALAGKLDRDGADTAGATDDEQGAGVAAGGQLQAVEEHLPGSDGGQRKRGGFGEGQAGGFGADYPSIDHVALAVATWSGHAAGV